jgi:hypothetical protein
MGGDPSNCLSFSLDYEFTEMHSMDTHFCTVQKKTQIVGIGYSFFWKYQYFLQPPDLLVSREKSENLIHDPLFCTLKEF